MANGNTHRIIGTFSGLGFSVYKAKDQQGLPFLLESVGGSFGGYLGGRAPDIFEPPIHPNHRSTAHGFLPVLTIGYLGADWLTQWQKKLRDTAQHYSTLSEQATTEFEKIWFALLAMVLRFFCGVLAGMYAGYGSHIVLDAMTPKGLPLY
jgi:hypothetical protein